MYLADGVCAVRVECFPTLVFFYYTKLAGFIIKEVGLFLYTNDIWSTPMHILQLRKYFLLSRNCRDLIVGNGEFLLVKYIRVSDRFSPLERYTPIKVTNSLV